MTIILHDMQKNWAGIVMDKNTIRRKETLKRVGKVIRKNRQKKNISQEMLGKAISLSDSNITRYEQGTIEIPVSVLPLISETCRFKTIEYLDALEPVDYAAIMKEAVLEKTRRDDDFRDTLMAEINQSETSSHFMTPIHSLEHTIDMTADIRLLARAYENMKADMGSVAYTLGDIMIELTAKENQTSQAELAKRVMTYYEEISKHLQEGD